MGIHMGYGERAGDFSLPDPAIPRPERIDVLDNLKSWQSSGRAQTTTIFEELPNVILCCDMVELGSVWAAVFGLTVVQDWPDEIVEIKDFIH